MKITKPKIIAASWLLLIIAGGLLLQTYNLNKWLHFQLDQARDAYVIDEALEKGVSHLPLLGPRAAGSYLRLGPAFYYLEYLSAKIGLWFKQPSPLAMAYASVFFGSLSIWIFYLFIRRYWSRSTSLALSALYASSLFLTLYFRFAWNPNWLPFFILLTFYALLRATDVDEKKPKIWFYLSVLSLSIATQLHFLAFLSLPVIVLIYLLIKRPHFKMKTYLIALAILMVIYLPVFINEIKTGGANTQQFFQTLTEKSKSEKERNFLVKTLSNFENQAEYYFIIISGWEGGKMPEIESYKKRVNLKCDHECHKGLVGEALAISIYISGIILLLMRLWKSKPSPQKDFLILNSLWLGIAFALMIPLVFKTAPRFYLISAPLSFILLGFVLVYLKKKFDKNSSFLFWLLIIILVVSNLWFTYQRFQQLKIASIKNVKIFTDKILKEKTRVTWEQENKITQYMSSFYKKNHYPIFRSGDPHYLRALAYLLDKESIPNQSIKLDEIYQQGNYFYIKRTSSNNKGLNKYLTKFILVKRKEFGTLTIYYLKPQIKYVTAIKSQVKRRNKIKKENSIAPRYQWKDIFKK